MKAKIKLNGVTVEREIPTNWKQVTFRQFMKLAECGSDEVKIISLFTGVEEATLKKATLYNLGQILNALSFLKNQEMDYTVPESILGYKIPKNLEFETIGQYQDLKLEAGQMKEGDIKSFEKYPHFVAIYATTPYDFQEAEKKIDYFFDAPCEEVMAVGNFTLLKLAELTNGIRLNFQKSNSPMKKLKLALVAWLKNSIFTLRYYIWKRRLRLHEKSY